MAADVFTLTVVGYGEAHQSESQPGAIRLCTDLVVALKRAGIEVRKASVLEGNPDMRAFDHNITNAELHADPPSEVTEVSKPSADA